MGIGRRCARLGLLPWTGQTGLVGFIPGSGKAFLPGWPGIHTRQRGAFSPAALFCCPRALLSAWQKLIPLQLGRCLQGLPGPASLLLPLSLPWLLPCSLFSLALWLALAGGSQGSPRWELRHGKGQLGQAEAAQRQGESAVAQGEGALRLRDSWERA